MTKKREALQNELFKSLLIDSLSPRERKLYSLKYVELRSIKEIAAKLSQPEGTVKYHLYKLREHLRSMRPKLVEV